jgi:hypothetical protein
LSLGVFGSVAEFFYEVCSMTDSVLRKRCAGGVGLLASEVP